MTRVAEILRRDGSGEVRPVLDPGCGGDKCLVGTRTALSFVIQDEGAAAPAVARMLSVISTAAEPSRQPPVSRPRSASCLAIMAAHEERTLLLPQNCCLSIACESMNTGLVDA